jgi:hypothetical protein
MSNQTPFSLNRLGRNQKNRASFTSGGGRLSRAFRKNNPRRCGISFDPPQVIKDQQLTQK